MTVSHMAYQVSVDAEMHVPQAVLSVLVKNFVYELRDGPETKIEIGRGFLPRPRVAGEVGCKMPLRVKPYMG